MSKLWHENPMMLLGYRLNRTLSAVDRQVTVSGANWRAIVMYVTARQNDLIVERDGLPTIKLRVKAFATDANRQQVNAETLRHVRALISTEVRDDDISA